jgi:hypothetical protein
VGCHCLEKQKINQEIDNMKNRQQFSCPSFKEAKPYSVLKSDNNIVIRHLLPATTDSTIREKTQDSIFSNAPKNVPISRQSSGICMIFCLACLPLELLLHRIGEIFLSIFAILFVLETFIIGLDCREMPKVCVIISLKTTVFDSQNVSLQKKLDNP